MADAPLKARVLEDTKRSMKGRDKPRVAALRLIAAAIKQLEVDERRELDDSQIVAVLDKMAKQRRESIEQFSKAQRHDLVDQGLVERNVKRTLCDINSAATLHLQFHDAFLDLMAGRTSTRAPLWPVGL